ncbi:hypothetical protein BGZ50_009667 [Haplosporangium sp. Z 11]|nr:hypothetical protein BGZ50_009667 [Haplosporangium sp. Z 11]
MDIRNMLNSGSEVQDKVKQEQDLEQERRRQPGKHVDEVVDLDLDIDLDDNVEDEDMDEAGKDSGSSSEAEDIAGSIPAKDRTSAIGQDVASSSFNDLHSLSITAPTPENDPMCASTSLAKSHLAIHLRWRVTGEHTLENDLMSVNTLDVARPLPGAPHSLATKRVMSQIFEVSSGMSLCIFDSVFVMSVYLRKGVN